jgi:multidrug efflux pump subunit AcrA (membrane-fusion protein)
MSKFLTWIVVAALLAVGVGAVYISTAGQGGASAATTSYLTRAAALGTVTRSAAATGTIAAADSYSLDFGVEPRLSGSTGSTASANTWVVDEILVAVGDRVAAGQVLARADTTDLEDQKADLQDSLEVAQLSSGQAKESLTDSATETRRQLVDADSAVKVARLNLTAAQEQYQDASSGSPKRQARIALIGARDQLRSALRSRSDLEEQLKGGFPDQTIALREAEAQVRDLESQIEDLDTQLALAELVAPVDGTVSSIGMVEGLAAPASDALVLESASLEVDADVVEADISSLAVGQPALVSIDALDLEVPGTVTSVAPVATAASGSVVTFPVTVSLDEAQEAIRPGMSSDVEITIAEAADVVVVPLTAVMSSPAGDVVRVLGSDGSPEARPVTVGLASETMAEIQSGVAVGDEVVVGTNAERAASTAESDADEFRGGFGAAGGLEGLAGAGGPRFVIPERGQQP